MKQIIIRSNNHDINNDYILVIDSMPTRLSLATLLYINQATKILSSIKVDKEDKDNVDLIIDNGDLYVMKQIENIDEEYKLYEIADDELNNKYQKRFNEELEKLCKE